jgi:MFS family permease
MAKHVSSWFYFHFWFRNVRIVEYYVHVTLLQIGKSMTNLFIPIYLLTDLKFEIWQVLFFYFMWQILFVPSVLFAGQVIKQIGLKRSIAFSLPFYVLLLWAMNKMGGGFVSDMIWITPFLFLRAITWAFANVANDIFMAKHILKKKPGKMLAWLRIFMTIGTLLAPLIGGLISFFFGFEALFLFAMGIILLSAIPLLIVSKGHFEINYKPESLLQFLRHKARPNYLIAEFGNVFTDTVMWILWPIFLFFALETTAEMGTLVTASAVASILVSYFIGKKIKQLEPKKMIRFGVRIASLLFFARPLFLHPVIIGLIDSVYKMVDPIFRIPYDQAAYRLVMKNENLVKMANVKQLVAESYYTITVTLLFVFTLFFSEFSKIFFVIIFLGSAVFMLLMERMAHVKFTKVDEREIIKKEDKEVVDKSLEVIQRGEF